MPRLTPTACFYGIFLLLVPFSGPASADTRIERYILASQVLGEDRPLNIVQPAADPAGGTFPVVYVLDGGSRYLAAMAESMQAVRPDLIVVGVENVDRDRDMFPDALPDRGNRGGGGAKFLEFLISEVVPNVEAEYPANGYRILAGQSNSGFFVLYALLQAPDAFDAFLAGSPMIGWDWDMIRTGSIELLADRKSFPKALFMNRGETDLDRCTEFLPLFGELLGEIAPADFRWKHEIAAGDGHVPQNTYENGIAFILDGR